MDKISSNIENNMAIEYLNTVRDVFVVVLCVVVVAAFLCMWWDLHHAETIDQDTDLE